MVVITVSAVANKPPSFARNALPLKVDVSPEDTVLAVKKKIAATIPKFHPSRQKLVLPSDKKKALADETTAKELGLSAGGELEIKDLGPQAGWRTVYVVEYMGPLIIHPVVYNFPELFYGKPVEHSSLQKFCCIMITLHFFKRVLESLFVHRFSHGTMPLFNIFKNSAHYHILSGILLAYDLYRPAFSTSSPFIKGTPRANDQYLFVFILFWTLFELGNLNAHLILRSLRPAGTKKRSIPYGFGFGLVSCPHYYFEAMGWITISLMTRSYAAYLFTIVGTAQMLVWALKRHRQYKKEFGKEYPRNRKAMFPFLI
ncbi:synaptic glycoprotein sc2 [Moniliophthora roreri MCA 2997]|uniref:Synaptic glycoprotein sc2 n=2 Tax=Moniliophthora roreri TaxID=221103 RepID=V2XDL3_MONRO|nr:synaptic glycoprotein sc2 [Moniliophthora roreri MCA 2997]